MIYGLESYFFKNLTTCTCMCTSQELWSTGPTCVMPFFKCWTCNLEDPSSSPTLTASGICFTENLSFKSSATLVNSQLVCLRPVGILNPVMCNLYVDLIIYSTALKSPNGEYFLYLKVIHCN